MTEKCQTFTVGKHKGVHGAESNRPDYTNGWVSADLARNLASVPGSERAPGEGNSCLENSVDRGAW